MVRSSIERRLPCGALALAASVSVFAAEPEPVSLEEIVVTATRRETSLLDTPASVSVMSAEDLARIGAAGFEDYARSIPGLNFSSSYAGDKYSIRGISSSVIPDRAPLTAVMLDDVPITDAGGLWQTSYPPDLELFDIQRIEVLRGPQGTLFGASAMGGAIRLMSTPPDPSRLESLSDAGVATTAGAASYVARSVLNVPAASHRAATRVAAYRRTQAGYLYNQASSQADVNDGAIQGARASQLWEASDRLRVTGRVLYQDGNFSGSTFDDVATPPRVQSRKTPESHSDRIALYTLAAQYDMGGMELVSSTSFLDRKALLRLDITDAADTLFGISGPVSNALDERTGEWAQEFRLHSGSGERLDWVSGLLFQQRRFDSVLDFLAPGFDASTGGQASQYGYPDNLLRESLAATQRQYAVFGDARYRFAPAAALSLGARVFRFSDDSTVLLGGYLNQGTTVEDVEYAESGVTPKVTVSWSPQDLTTTYLSVASGFRPGGANPAGNLANTSSCQSELAAAGYAGLPTLKSDSLWSYELGLRASPWERFLSYTLAVYHVDWSRIQTNHFLNCGIVFNENAGRATSDGVELELRAFPMDRVEIRAMGSYGEAQLAEDVPNLGGHKGDRLPAAPRNLRSVSAGYRVLSLGGIPAWLRADYQYVGKSQSAIDASRREMPSYERVNARLAFEGGAWDVAVYARNLLDARGIQSTLNFGIPSLTYELATDPRTVGIIASLRY